MTTNVLGDLRTNDKLQLLLSEKMRPRSSTDDQLKSIINFILETDFHINFVGNHYGICIHLILDILEMLINNSKKHRNVFEYDMSFCRFKSSGLPDKKKKIHNIIPVPRRLRDFFKRIYKNSSNAYYSKIKNNAYTLVNNNTSKQHYNFF